jgi:hypothetical protein
MPIVSRTQFQTDTDTLYPDNTTGEISPADLRAQMDNIADSAVFRGIGFAAAPTANDDSSGNNGNGEFNIGDIWIDETNNNAYVCLDDTDLAAVWALIGGGLTVTSQTGTATAGQLATWASATEIRGDAELTWNGGNRLAIASPDPVLELQDNDGVADNQRWLTWVDSGNFKIQAFTDAGVGGDDYLQLTRTGNVIDSLDFLTGGAVATSIGANTVDFTGAASTVQTTDAQPLSLGTNGVDRLTFSANTYVSQFAGLAANLVGVQVGDSSLTTGNAELHLGVGRTGDGVSRIEFVGDTTYTTYGLRLQRGPGENALSILNHRGTGNLLLQTVDAADLILGTSNTPAVTIDGATQVVTFANPPVGLGVDAVPAQDDGVEVVAAPTALNFTGAGVTVTDAAGVATVNIPGGSNLQTVVEVTDAFKRVLPSESGVIYKMDSASPQTLEILGVKSFAVSGISQANPGVVTVASTAELADGDEVTFDSVGGMVEVNGNTYTVTVIDATTFSIGVDTTGFTAYTTGGTFDRSGLTYDEGHWFEVVQAGAGTVTVQGGSGVAVNGTITIPGTAGGDITGQWGVMKAHNITGWVFSGDIGAIS